MSRNSWHIHADEQRYVLTRQWPPQFDVLVEVAVPVMRRGRLAQQVRQDLWRELKYLRGFSPVVEIVHQDEGMALRAGGRLPKQARSTAVINRIEAVLNDPVRHARWFAWAGQAKVQTCAS